MENAEQLTSADAVLDLLRQLPPWDRLKVLVQALPEIEQELAVPPGPLRSLRGLWKDVDQIAGGRGAAGALYGDAAGGRPDGPEL